MHDTLATGWAGRLMLYVQWAVQIVLVSLLWTLGTLAGLVVAGFWPASVATVRLMARLRGGDASTSLVLDFVRHYRAVFLDANRAGLALSPGVAMVALNVGWVASGAAVPLALLLPSTVAALVSCAMALMWLRGYALGAGSLDAGPLGIGPLGLRAAAAATLQRPAVAVGLLAACAAALLVGFVSPPLLVLAVPGVAGLIVAGNHRAAANPLSSQQN